MSKTFTYVGYTLIAFCLVLAGCDTAGPDTGEDTATIEGQIVDAKTGEPLSGVTITTEPATKTATTDANGQFVLDGIEPGSYTITAEASGYASRTADVTVKAGETAQVSMGLTPETATIEGQVVNSETGDPLADVTITTIPATTTSTTDAEGRFVLEDLEPGEYTIIAQTSGYESNSTVVTVDGGETQQVTLRLTEETGEVINKQGPIMPLGVGNTWVFTYKDTPYRLEMTETVEIDGETYYHLVPNYGDSRVTNQYVTDSTDSGNRVGTIIFATGTNESTFFKYPITDDEVTYTYTEPNGETHTYTAQKETITVPTGTFAVITYSGYTDNSDVTFSLAPGVGPVRLTYSDGSAAVLVDCQTDTYACQ